MRTLPIALSSLLSLGLMAPLAHAAPPKSAQQQRLVKVGSVHIPEHEVPLVHRELTDLKIARQRRVAGFTFQKIVKGDFTGEYVFERNAKVTAFLDPADVSHPRYNEDFAHSGSELIAPQKRIKFLVTPNKLHEHIGSSLDNEVTEQDLELALDTMREAKRLAAQLGIKNPRIWVNNQNTASIGQLHVHVLGERPAGFKYPAQLQSLASAQ